VKKHYPDLTDFDNLPFVKDCKEEGLNEYKKKVIEIISKNGRHEGSNEVIEPICLRILKELK